MAHRRVKIAIHAAPKNQASLKKGLIREFGAPPIRRFIQKVIIDQLADKKLSAAK